MFIFLPVYFHFFQFLPVSYHSFPFLLVSSQFFFTVFLLLFFPFFLFYPFSSCFCFFLFLPFSRFFQFLLISDRFLPFLCVPSISFLFFPFLPISLPFSFHFFLFRHVFPLLFPSSCLHRHIQIRIGTNDLEMTEKIIICTLKKILAVIYSGCIIFCVAKL